MIIDMKVIKSSDQVVEADLQPGVRIQVDSDPDKHPLPRIGVITGTRRWSPSTGESYRVIVEFAEDGGQPGSAVFGEDFITIIEEQKDQTIPLWPGERQEIPGNSLIKFNLTNYFIYGIGSVLEFFPSPERFDVWRVAQDVPINEWPLAVRGLLAELQEDASQRGVSS